MEFNFIGTAIRDLAILLVHCNKAHSFSANFSEFQNFGLFLLSFLNVNSFLHIFKKKTLKKTQKQKNKPNPSVK
jgi:hypothetical protein